MNKQPWWQVSLRELILIVTIVCLALGWSVDVLNQVHLDADYRTFLYGHWYDDPVDVAEVVPNGQ